MSTPAIRPFVFVITNADAHIQQIKGDLNRSNFILDTMPLSDLSWSKLNDVTKLFNLNVAAVNALLDRSTPELSFEEYVSLTGPSPIGADRADYQSYARDLSKRNMLRHRYLDLPSGQKEAAELQKQFNDLRTRLVEQLQQLNAANPKQQLLVSLETVFQPKVYAPQTQEVQKPTAVAATVKVETQVDPTKISVTALVELSPGQTLGICCEPNWQQQPIAFTKTADGWKGLVPVKQEWKFVTLENGKVTGWEQMEGNHFCDDRVVFEVKF